MNNLQPSFRFAQRKDTGLILAFIKALAEYEKMAGNVIATEELLEEWIFDKGKAEVLFVVENGIPVGFALFFHNFSTFLGRAGIYLEDLFILPEHRGKGYGKAILKKLAATAVERGCGRLEWSCLDWNRPSIDFYLSLGAEPMEDWTMIQRIRPVTRGTYFPRNSSFPVCSPPLWNRRYNAPALHETGPQNGSVYLNAAPVPW